MRRSEAHTGARTPTRVTDLGGEKISMRFFSNVVSLLLNKNALVLIILVLFIATAPKRRRFNFSRSLCAHLRLVMLHEVPV